MRSGARFSFRYAVSFLVERVYQLKHHHLRLPDAVRLCLVSEPLPCILCPGSVPVVTDGAANGVS